MSDKPVGVAPEVAEGKVNQTILVFSFCEPIPVLEGRAVFDYLEYWLKGRWY